MPPAEKMFETASNNTLKISLIFKLWRRTFGLIRKAVPGLTIVWGILLIVQGILPGALVYLTKLTIDSFFNSSGNERNVSDFYQAFFFLALTGLCLLLTEVFQSISEWVRTAQAEYFSDYLKNLVYEKAAEVDLEFYESPAYHDLMEQARGEAQAKPLALLESLGAVVQSAITLLTFGAMLFAYGWFIPLLLIIGTLPGLYVSLKFDRIYHRWWRETAKDRRWLSYYDSMLTNSLAAAELRLFDISHKFRRQYSSLRGKLRTEKLNYLRKQFYGKLFVSILSLATAVIAIGWIAVRVLYNLASFSDLAVFYQVFSRGQTLMRSLLGGVGQTFNHSLYLENLFAFLDLKPKMAAPQEYLPFPARIESGISFRDVTFCYPRETRAAIKDFNLFIPAGRVAAIVGVNGAGKSTLIKLLSRFYDPQEGAIEIDGTDIRRFDPKQLRKNISVLFQFPLQFCGTAAESITLEENAEKVSSETLQNIAKRAGAHEFLSRLPRKYQSILGKWFVNGCELSGGEWQKIALARAYFRQSQLIVLDEPTSFMDSWAEADWFERFRSIAENRTGLIITHRFTIAMRADVIHVLDGGQLVETGTHRELIAADGFYAESWKTQMQAAEETENESSPIFEPAAVQL